MELPDNLKKPYRHWNHHSFTKNNVLLQLEEFPGDKKLLKSIIVFVNERLKIWEKKALGGTPSYTRDLVLSKYRFCNIFREFDRQTIEFHELLNPLREDFPRWLLNMFYCRLAARPETVKLVGLLSFDKENNQRLYSRLKESPRPRYGTAYVFPVSAIQKSQTPTREKFLTEYLPKAIPLISDEIEKWKRMAVFDGLEKIISIFGFNLRFLWTEVLIDVSYQFPEYIDLFGRFPIGPGALPTLRLLNQQEDPSFLVSRLSELNVDTGLTYNGKKLRLSPENWEGIACEYRKYSNLKLGKGRKRLYVTGR